MVTKLNGYYYKTEYINSIFNGKGLNYTVEIDKETYKRLKKLIGDE